VANADALNEAVSLNEGDGFAVSQDWEDWEIVTLEQVRSLMELLSLPCEEGFSVELVD